VQIDECKLTNERWMDDWDKWMDDWMNVSMIGWLIES
jgi:hypothetical protein